jgi:hypothetical protein
MLFIKKKRVAYRLRYNKINFGPDTFLRTIHQKTLLNGLKGTKSLVFTLFLGYVKRN